ncbi:MAG: prohibitin family protein [Endomicrobiales bacterium]|nr:prohibitin family protein [Endomicrobiales bacterium]
MENFGAKENKMVFMAVVGLIALIIAVPLLSSWFFVVGAGQVGVTFNSISGATQSYQQGFHTKFPFVVSVTKFDVKTQRIDVSAESASKDLQKVQVDIALNYHLDYTKVNELFVKVGKDYREKVIDPAVNEAVKSATAQFPVEQIIVQREDLKNKIEGALKTKLATYNIIVENVSLVNIRFDTEFEKVVEQKQIEEQKIKTAEYVKQQAEQNKAATILKAEGEAKAQQLLRESVNEKTIAYKWIDKWDGKLPSTMLGDKSNILFTPKTSKDEQ